jgi:hypothetical protein
VTDDAIRETPLGLPRPAGRSPNEPRYRRSAHVDPDRRVLPSAFAVKVRRLHRVDETGPAPSPPTTPLPVPEAAPVGRVRRILGRLPWLSQWVALRRVLDD